MWSQCITGVKKSSRQATLNPRRPTSIEQKHGRRRNCKVQSWRVRFVFAKGNWRLPKNSLQKKRDIPSGHCENPMYFACSFWFTTPTFLTNPDLVMMHLARCWFTTATNRESNKRMTRNKGKTQKHLEIDDELRNSQHIELRKNLKNGVENH